MLKNIGLLDLIFRITLGTIFIVLAYIDIFSTWSYVIGGILLATALLKRCPLYALLGLQTCPLHTQVKR